MMQQRRACLYARYSTDKQSESSVDDQFRLCERLAEQHGFIVAKRFSDAAISGGTSKRPGYQEMLYAARRREFDVIVAEDTSRLWRLLAEQAPRLAELADLGIFVVTHDLDTRMESSAVLGAVTGAMSEQYRKEIARRTRRGLEGRARRGKSAGGRAYGYRVVHTAISDTEVAKEIAIDPAQAEVVLRIFEMYADGKSTRAIAGILNAEGVPSPSTTLKRTVRRKSKWVASALWGNPKRGLGILHNELYIGRQIWNRFKWIRSAVDSSKRRAVQNPQSEWVVNEREDLRIIPQFLWDRVRQRQKAQSYAVGYRVKEGLADARKSNGGRRPRYLLSGLLQCPECGGGYTIVSHGNYACSTHRNGGEAACANGTRFKRLDAEKALLTGLQERMLDDDTVEYVREAVIKMVREQGNTKPNTANRRRLLEAEIANLTDAIASGGLHASQAIAARLQEAEAALADLQKAAEPPSVRKIERLLPCFVAEHRAFVGELADTLADVDVDQARSALKNTYGPVRARQEGESVLLEIEHGGLEAAVLCAAGAYTDANVVAGEGLEPPTRGL